MRLDGGLPSTAARPFTGARPFTVFRRIILPLSLPGVLAGTVLVGILCMNAYATPVLLGGVVAAQTLQVLLHLHLLQVQLQRRPVALGHGPASALGSRWRACVLSHRPAARSLRCRSP